MIRVTRQILIEIDVAHVDAVKILTDLEGIIKPSNVTKDLIELLRNQLLNRE